MCYSDEIVSNVLTNLGIGIYLLDSEMNLVWFNDEIKNWFGVTQKPSEKSKCYKVIFNRDHSCNNCPALKIEKASEVDFSNILLRSFSGDKRQFRFQAKFTNQNQKLIMVMDITDQYQSERMREDFIATLTHDLRTPLLAELRTLEFLTKGHFGSLNERQNEVLEAMLISNRDLLSLVKNLLEVYRYEAGAKVLSTQNFDIAELIEDCIFELSALSETKGIRISSDLPEILPLVFADKREIWRVLTNLIGNAIEYTHQNGEVCVRVSAESEYIVIEVADNGRGIPELEINQLFERFSQGTSANISSGTGLGLYLSKQIVQAHNGKIWAESKLDQGSHFYFSLPVTY